MIRKKGSKYILVSKSTGRTLGTHSSRSKAMAQERAIQVSKHKRK